MMKKLRIIFAILICLFALASCTTYKNVPLSTIKEESRVITDYTGTKSKDELFTLCNEWLFETFNSPAHVITYSDKESGIMLGGFSRIVPLGGTYDITVEFLIKIECKEHKVKLTISEPTQAYYYPAGYKVMKDAVTDNAIPLFASDTERLFKTLDTKINSESSSNW